MLALTLALAAFPVRAELVEASSATPQQSGLSTSPRRTEIGSAIEAERAFAADAQRIGQWAAFRKWAAPDATMFTPQPVAAQEWLKGRDEPAKVIAWWPTASWISCDGTLAVNTGGWRRPEGSVGFFSTVWRRQPDGGWKWIVYGGDTVKQARPRPNTLRAIRASCTTPEPAYSPPTGAHAGAGASTDHSLVWEWAFNATGHTRVFFVSVWNGQRYVDALEDLIAVE